MENREIEFRGYFHSEENGLYPEVKKWIYGSLEVRNKDSYWITDKEDISRKYKVDPETVGQYIGKENYYGEKVYEGDILKEGDYLFLVVWSQSHVQLQLKYINKAIQYPEWNRGFKMKKIGNKFDNPELLRIQ